MATISIIVPIYNVEKYLGKCLSSLRDQTFEDIEVIGVDDASTDESPVILDRFAECDSRFRSIHLRSNSGTLQARKRGVEAASGDYILFLDSDDWLESNTCEILLKRIQDLKVDILQFGSNVIPAIPLSESMSRWIEEFLEPYCHRVEGEAILRNCFVKGWFDFNITDKMWRADLCREAFRHLEERRMVTAEDQYAFFVLAYFAESYQGIPDARYYNYNIGIGITGGDILDMSRFEKRCAGVEASDAVLRFLESKQETERFKDIYCSFRERLLWDCVDCWHNKLEPVNRGEGYDILLKYWKPEEIVGAIGRMYFEDKEEIEAQIQQSRVTKTVYMGIYYRYLGYEPMDGYIDSLVKSAKESGFKVIIFTDADALWDDREKPLSYGASVEVLPPSLTANWGDYVERAKALADKMRQTGVTEMLYVSPKSHIAWLDVLLLKSMGLQVQYANEEYAVEESRKEIRNHELENMVNELENTAKELEDRVSELSAELAVVKASKAYKACRMISRLLRRTKDI